MFEKNTELLFFLAKWKKFVQFFGIRANRIICPDILNATHFFLFQKKKARSPKNKDRFTFFLLLSHVLTLFGGGGEKRFLKTNTFLPNNHTQNCFQKSKNVHLTIRAKFFRPPSPVREWWCFLFFFVFQKAPRSEDQPGGFHNNSQYFFQRFFVSFSKSFFLLFFSGEKLNFCTKLRITVHGVRIFNFLLHWKTN